MKLTLCILLLFALSGCATLQEPYWYPDASMKGVVRLTRYVENPCGRKDLTGCWMRVPGIIEIRAGMDEWATRCAELHELRHSDGNSHTELRLVRPDCGDSD